MIKTPQNWELVNVRDITVEHKQGFYTTDSYDDAGNAQLLRITDLLSPRIDYVKPPKILVNEKEFESFKVTKGDFLFGRSGAIGRYGICYENHRVIFASYLIRFRFDQNKILNEFFGELYSSSFVSKQLEVITQGSSNQNINADNIKALLIPLPPLGEQKKIAEILSTWDNSIETTEKLIAAKQKLKKSLMQRLLTGSQRFPEFHGQKLNYKYLGEVAFESTERNKNSMTSEKLMAVMKSAGMIPMRERVQSENVSRCKIVAPKWFAYNPMRLNIGSIAQWNGDETVMVSGDYVVFKCNESLLDPDYLNHFRKSYGWTNFVKNSGDGSVRIRIYFSHLADLKILLPSLEEQKKISAVLNASDAEINVLQKKLAALRQQKRGLMQKLLTGETRVKVDEKDDAVFEN